MNNQDEEIESLYDDEPEEMDEASEAPESANEGIEEVGDVSEPDSSYNPQNSFRRNQEYHDRNYYKDRVAESEKKLDEAKIKRNDAKSEQQRSWKKNDPNDKGPVKSDGSNTHEKTRKEKRQDKKDVRQANRDVRQAKRDNRRAKFDKLRNTADTIAHPADHAKNYLQNKIKNKMMSPLNKAKGAAKEGVKKVGKAIASKMKLGPGLLKSKVVLLVIGVILGIFAISIIFVVTGDASNSKNGSNGSYSYNIDGQEVKNVSVKVMNSSNSVVETVSMEQYAKGVALNALGVEALDSNPEALKAAIVIARSSILDNSDVTSGTVEMNNTSDLVYWDYTNDLYKLETENGVDYSPEITAETPNAELVYKALTPEQIEKYNMIADDVGGVYITGESAKGVVLDSTTISSIKSKETDDKLNDYSDIIASQYPDATINTGEFVGYTFSGEAGDYANWKQVDEQWGNIQLGNGSGTTMAKIGCYVTSYAIAIAYLEAPTTIDDFNPGTFATELKKNGAFGSGGGFNNFNAATKIVPGLKKERISASGLTMSEKIAKVRKDAESGYAIIMQVKCSNYYANGGCGSGDTHFVVLDPMTSAANDWSTLSIWNPSGKKTWAQYGNVLPYYDRVWVAK